MRRPTDEINIILSITAMILNGTLLPVIIFRSSSDISTYKYLLALYTTIAGLFAVFSFTLDPIFISSELAWIIVGFGPLADELSQFWGGIILTFYCTCYCALLTSLVLSYFYRYIYVCKQEWRDWFKKPMKVAIIISFYLLIIVHWGVASFFTMRPSAGTNELYNSLLIQYTERNGADSIYIGHTAYVNGHYETTMIVIVAERFCFIIFANVTINIFALLVVRQFKHDMSLISKSTKIYKMQWRLFTLLRLQVLQTFCPILTTYIPALTSIILTFNGKESYFFMNLISVLMNIGIVIDPILIIVMVTDYRNYFLNIIPCRKGEQKVTPAHSIIEKAKN